MATPSDETRSTLSFKPNFKRWVIGISSIVILGVMLSMVGSMIEDLDAGENMVVQAVGGKLTAYTEPGWHLQLFGKVTKYKKSFQFEATGDDAIKVRFSDGGHALMSLSCRIDNPSIPASILALHIRYGSQKAIENDLIKRQIEKAVYMTGSVMTSKESYSEKRPDLLFYVDDQAMNGVYKTHQSERRDTDPLTGEQRTITVIELERDSVTGKFSRQEESPLVRFGISLYGFAINNLDYDKTVEDQIQSQQQAYMNVQTAISRSKQAEQDAMTAEQQGKAKAATAKWEQEVIKATEVTRAEQLLEVQKLSTQTAELYKKQQILEGEGDAEKKRLAMQANGALEQKLAAYIEVNKNYADALRQSQLVPTIIMGNAGSGANSSAIDFLNLLTAKTARDIALDLKEK